MCLLRTFQEVFSKTRLKSQNNELELLDGNILEGVRISPSGKICEGIDGRSYEINGKAVIKSLIANELNIPLLKEHGWTRADNRAYGWIKPSSLKVENEYIIGNIELTDDGIKLVKDNSYRYFSPAYMVSSVDYENNHFVVENIAHIGLVNEPNLRGLKLHLQEENNMANKQEPNKQEPNKQEPNKQESNKQEPANASISLLEKEINSLKIENAIANKEIFECQRDLCTSLNQVQIEKLKEANKVLKTQWEQDELSQEYNFKKQSNQDQRQAMTQQAIEALGG